MIRHIVKMDRVAKDNKSKIEKQVFHSLGLKKQNCSLKLFTKFNFLLKFYCNKRNLVNIISFAESMTVS